MVKGQQGEGWHGRDGIGLLIGKFKAHLMLGLKCHKFL